LFILFIQTWRVFAKMGLHPKHLTNRLSGLLRWSVPHRWW